jgi:methionyl aminopeptidase
MIRLKNTKQIDGIRSSCRMLGAMYRELIPLVKPDVETMELDHWTRNWIKRAGGKPAFLGYGPKRNPFPAALCISINNEIIHGIPSKRRIQEGDLVSLDSGIILDGYVSDQAVSIEVGRVSAEVHRLNTVTRECLYKGIEAMKAGGRLLQIARAVEGHALAHGYGVVREYGGHGVGLSLHEDPHVSNYPHGPNPRMNNGLVIAIEPMITMGGPEIQMLEDNWTIVTADGQAASHWEHTVAICDDQTEILTERLDQC